MKSMRSTWVLLAALVALFSVVRLMTTSRAKDPVATRASEPVQPRPTASAPAVASAPASPAAANRSGRGFRAVGLAVATAVMVAAMGAGAAIAATSVDSPGQVQEDTVRLNWTGQGASGSQVNEEKCGPDADFAGETPPPGATADNYLHWIFSTDGGDVTDAPVTLTINGDTYTSSDGHHFITLGYDPASIADAHTNFVVADTGNGSWILTISHGCVGETVEDDVIDPAGDIRGPCADPAYFAIFDNTNSTVDVTFRFRWYNFNGIHVVKKTVPAGQYFITTQRWVKAYTTMRIGYKDPTTGFWMPLVNELSGKGRYPACTAVSHGYIPGFAPGPVPADPSQTP